MKGMNQLEENLDYKIYTVLKIEEAKLKQFFGIVACVLTSEPTNSQLNTKFLLTEFSNVTCANFFELVH